MTLSVVFLATTTPNVVYFIKINDWVAESSTSHSEAKLRLLFAVTNLLYYINNASNFFLYCVAGSRFRRAMLQLFSCTQTPGGRSGRQENITRLQFSWRGCSGRAAAGVEQASRSMEKTANRRRRTEEAPLKGTNSAVNLAAGSAARGITLSTNVTTHPLD